MLDLKIKKKMLVQTFKTPIQTSQKTLTAYTPTKNPPKRQEQPITPKKTEIKKSTPPKKTAPIKNTNPEIKKKPLPKKPLAAQPILKEQKKTPAKVESEIDNNRITSTSPLKVPPKIELNPKISKTSLTLTDNNDLDDDFTLSLIDHLQSHLQLPHIGEVKIQLTLRSNGTVEDLQVLSAESDKNKKRIEEKLPTLHFPSFSEKKGNPSSRIFILTFCNDS